MFKYGYVTHTNQRGMYKLDLANMRYTRSADLAPYNCVPVNIQFPALCKFCLLKILFYLLLINSRNIYTYSSNGYLLIKAFVFLQKLDSKSLKIQNKFILFETIC